MTHPERRQRRRDIAAYCRDHSRAEAAAAYGVTLGTVLTACQEFAQTDGHAQPMKRSTLQMLAALLRGEAQKEVAERHHVTPQFVSRLSRDALDAGVFDAAKEAPKC